MANSLLGSSEEPPPPYPGPIVTQGKEFAHFQGILCTSQT